MLEETEDAEAARDVRKVADNELALSIRCQIICLYCGLGVGSYERNKYE